MNGFKQRRWIIIPIFAVLVTAGLIALRPQNNGDALPALPASAAGANANGFALTSSASGANEWAMEGANPARTRSQQPEVALPMTRQRVLSVAGDTGDGSPPSIARNLMLLETPASLRALDLRSSTVRWDVPMPGSYVSPAVAGDRVFVRSEADNKGQVLALDVSSGKQLWSFTPKRLSSSETNFFGGHLTSPVIVDNTVYVGAGKEVYALDAGNGVVRWTYGAHDYITSSATVADGHVYISDFKHVYALDQASGTQLWVYTTVSSVSFSSVAAGQTVLVTNGDTLAALDSSTGKQRWVATYPGEGLVPGAVQGSQVYIKSTENVYALDLSTGKELWRFHDLNFVSLPAVAGDQVFVVSGMGPGTAVAALDGHSGKSLWQLPVPKLSTAAPVIAGQTVYVRTTDGRVLGFWH